MLRVLPRCKHRRNAEFAQSDFGRQGGRLTAPWRARPIGSTGVRSADFTGLSVLTNPYRPNEHGEYNRPANKRLSPAGWLMKIGSFVHVAPGLIVLGFLGCLPEFVAAAAQDRALSGPTAPSDSEEFGG